jgi:hypothetical protein
LKADLEDQLKHLPEMSRKALQAFWLELFDKPPHPKLRREILIPILAYRLQEKALGGLKPATVKRLRTFAEEFACGKKSTHAPAVRSSLGMRLVREWRGRLHEVAVQDNCFEYDGRTFRSLSEIAREITGTRWSGPAFFGLKKRPSKRAA